MRDKQFCSPACCCTLTFAAPYLIYKTTSFYINQMKIIVYAVLNYQWNKTLLFIVWHLIISILDLRVLTLQSQGHIRLDTSIPTPFLAFSTLPCAITPRNFWGRVGSKFSLGFISSKSENYTQLRVPYTALRKTKMLLWNTFHIIYD